MNAYCNNQTIIYHNGEFLKPEAASSSLYSQSLHYGNGVFEGIRSYKTEEGTKIFRAEAHYERLKYGAKVMGIPFDYTVADLVALTYELLEKNNLQDAYIRPLISTGANMGLYASKESFLTMQCWEWGKLMGDRLLRVKTSSFERPNPKSCFVEAKVTGHYVNSVLSTNEAKDAGYDEALLLDMHGNVAECSGANIFMEKDGKLYTPKKGSIMAGITRTTILEICEEEGIRVEEKHFKLEELKEADSSFFTGTAAEVVGLKSLDDYEFPLSWTDSLGYKLMQLYQQEVLGQRKSKLSNAL
ncbi:branched-chain amino acid transaminase [Gelidibacter sp. F2691]|nr:branched-chain amino acid transaminase [Gelidibacter sp. F2691]